MNWFKENNCRMCKKVFCCKKCREKHEISVHQIFPTCNICVYGKTSLEDPPQDLLIHINNQHWPLHCMLCKRLFKSFDELLKQNKCSLSCKEQNFIKKTSTPIEIESEKYESPPYFPKGQNNAGNMFSNLATSTPLQREENNLPEQNSHETITPVDYSEVNKDKKYISECASLKRKVTFCETPMTEKKPINKINTEDKFEGQIITPNIGESPPIFYSAKQNLQENTTPDENKNKNQTEKTPEQNIKLEDSTLWTSATTETPEGVIEADKQVVDTTTPVISKSKKRQINIVAPTPLRKKEMVVPIGLQSTAINSSQLEIENFTAPSKSDNELCQIFERFNTVSTSSSNIENKSSMVSSINAHTRIWTSVSQLVKNVKSAVQEFSSNSYSKTPLKRSLLEIDPTIEGPCVKRYKLTDIKCRRPIRDLTIVESSWEYRDKLKSVSNSTERTESISSSVAVRYKKTFVDKAVQTDE